MNVYGYLVSALMGTFFLGLMVECITEGALVDYLLECLDTCIDRYQARKHTR